MKYKNRNDHGITSMDNNKIRKLMKTLSWEFRGAVMIQSGRFTCHSSRVRVVVKRIGLTSIFLVSKAKSGSQKVKITCRSPAVRNLVLQFLRDYSGLPVAFENEAAS